MGVIATPNISHCRFAVRAIRLPRSQPSPSPSSPSQSASMPAEGYAWGRWHWPKASNNTQAGPTLANIAEAELSGEPTRILAGSAGRSRLGGHGGQHSDGCNAADGEQRNGWSNRGIGHGLLHNSDGGGTRQRSRPLPKCRPALKTPRTDRETASLTAWALAPRSDPDSRDHSRLPLGLPRKGLLFGVAPGALPWGCTAAPRGGGLHGPPRCPFVWYLEPDVSPSMAEAWGDLRP